MKTAVITGASSGLGADMARILAADGWALVLVARRKERLEELAAELKTPCRVYQADVTDLAVCRALHDFTADMDVQLLINNAGFGVLGEFKDTDLERELAMIDTNCKGLHALTKLYLADFVKNDCGKILNVASTAAYFIGPLMATYYATKAYVLKLSQSVNYELKVSGSKVRVAALCPGPFDTEFNSVAGVSFAIRGKSSKYIAAYALKKLFRGKTLINPGTMVKLGRIGARLAPDSLTARICYNMQRSKSGEANKK